MATMGNRSPGASFHSSLAEFGDLRLSPLVWLARILGGLLVYVQAEGWTLFAVLLANTSDSSRLFLAPGARFCLTRT